MGSSAVTEERGRGGRRRTSPRLLAAIALTILIVIAAVAVASTIVRPSPHLRGIVEPASPTYGTIDHVAIGRSVITGSILLCLDGPGSARITNVAYGRDPNFGALHITAFGVRPYYDHPLLVGQAFGTLADLEGGFDVGGDHRVSGLCPPDPHTHGWDWSPQRGDGIVELAVEVTRSSASLEGGPALDITYESGGRTEVYRSPFGFLLCAADCPRPDF